jgi:hypothetical protein
MATQDGEKLTGKRMFVISPTPSSSHQTEEFIFPELIARVNDVTAPAWLQTRLVQTGWLQTSRRQPVDSNPVDDSDIV